MTKFFVYGFILCEKNVALIRHGMNKNFNFNSFQQWMPNTFYQVDVPIKVRMKAENKHFKTFEPLRKIHYFYFPNTLDL